MVFDVYHPFMLEHATKDWAGNMFASRASYGYDWRGWSGMGMSTAIAEGVSVGGFSKLSGHVREYAMGT